MAEEQRLYRGAGMDPHSVPSGSGGYGQHGYGHPGGSNPGYIPDPYKVTPPPPYDDHAQYAQYPGQHHDLAAEYPGLYDQPGHLARPHLRPHPGGSSSSYSYAYPY